MQGETAAVERESGERSPAYGANTRFGKWVDPAPRTPRFSCIERIHSRLYNFAKRGDTKDNIVSVNGFE